MHEAGYFLHEKLSMCILPPYTIKLYCPAQQNTNKMQVPLNSPQRTFLEGFLQRIQCLTRNKENKHVHINKKNTAVCRQHEIPIK